MAHRTTRWSASPVFALAALASGTAAIGFVVCTQQNRLGPTTLVPAPTRKPASVVELAPITIVAEAAPAEPAPVVKPMHAHASCPAPAATREADGLVRARSAAARIGTDWSAGRRHLSERAVLSRLTAE